MTLDDLRKIAEAATPGEWVVGEPYDVQGASHCRCEGKGALVWEGQADINGEMMLTHVHEPSESRKSIFADDTSIYTKTIPHAYVIALSTSEYCEISKEDAEFIATFNPKRVLELLDENERLRNQVAARESGLKYAAIDIDQLEARLAAVEKLHQKRYYTARMTAVCAKCETAWPCDTIKVIKGAPK